MTAREMRLACLVQNLDFGRCLVKITEELQYGNTIIQEILQKEPKILLSRMGVEIQLLHFKNRINSIKKNRLNS